MESLLLIKILGLIALVLALIYGCFILAQKRKSDPDTKRLRVLEYQRLDLKILYAW